MDGKKKEQIGNLFHDGKVYATETVEVFDHDFPSLAEGVAVPHTLYDIERNEAYVNIGTSRDTSEFSCDSIRHWWYTYGILYYPSGNIHFNVDGWRRQQLLQTLYFQTGFTGCSGRDRH